MDARFPEHPLGERNRLALEWIPRRSSALLDAGSSWGYGTRHFSDRADKVSAVDPHSEAIEVASSRYPQIDFRTAPLEQLPFEDDSFETITCLDVFEHVNDEIRSLNELFRVLQPGGQLMLTTPHRGFFAFLDPQNLVRKIKRSDELIHRHYSVDSLLDLLDRSDWAGHYELVRKKRIALLVYPLTLWLGFVPGVPGFAKEGARQALELDYRIPYGRAAYCMALMVRKT